jgi:hypothetical protein
MESRATGAINLDPTGSIQGTHKSITLITGEVIVRRKWMALPVPMDVIIRLRNLTSESEK